MSFKEYYYTSAAPELFAALVTPVMLPGCFLINTHRTTVGVFLVALLISHALALLVDVPIWILLTAPFPKRVPLIKVLSFLSDLFLITAGALYAWCLTAYISGKQRVSPSPAWCITDLSGAAVLTCLLPRKNASTVLRSRAASRC